jgi:hypothetical protein
MSAPVYELDPATYAERQLRMRAILRDVVLEDGNAEAAQVQLAAIRAEVPPIAFVRGLRYRVRILAGEVGPVDDSFTASAITLNDLRFQEFAGEYVGRFRAGPFVGHHAFEELGKVLAVADCDIQRAEVE